jgi:hypothetical protein
MKYTFFLICLFLNIDIFCQNILPNSRYIDYPSATFEFKGNNIIFWESGTLNRDGSLKEPEKNIIGTYYLENINGIDFVNIRWNNNQNEKYLILYNNNLCFLYKNDGPIYFRGFRITNAAPGEFCFSINYSNVQIESSSYLTEGNISYTTKNLNSNIGICWAEGVNGNGINEKLFIKMENANTLHISAGFVSFNKTYLFRENSRPKKIKLSVENKYSIIVDIEDTPNFHTIKLPEKLNKNETLVMEILEIHLGTKYEDTCINMVLVDEAIY